MTGNAIGLSRLPICCRDGRSNATAALAAREILYRGKMLDWDFTNLNLKENIVLSILCCGFGDVKECDFCLNFFTVFKIILGRDKFAIFKMLVSRFEVKFGGEKIAMY